MVRPHAGKVPRIGPVFSSPDREAVAFADLPLLHGSGPEEDVGPVGSHLPYAVTGERAVLDIFPVPGAMEPGREHGAAGDLPPRDVLPRPGVRNAARGQSIPGRAAVAPGVAE